MSAYPQSLDHDPFLSKGIISAIDTLCAGDVFLFENFDSPFYANTGISLAYISCVTENSFVIQKYHTKDARIPVRHRVEKEIPFAQISSLELRFPFAPDGRIYSISLRE